MENNALSSNITVSGIFTYIAMVYIYVLIVIGMEHRIFGLVSWLPDNVISWAGQTFGPRLGGEVGGDVDRVRAGTNNLPGGGGSAVNIGSSGFAKTPTSTEIGNKGNGKNSVNDTNINDGGDRESSAGSQDTNDGGDKAGTDSGKSGGKRIPED